MPSSHCDNWSNLEHNKLCHFACVPAFISSKHTFLIQILLMETMLLNIIQFECECGISPVWSSPIVYFIILYQRFEFLALPLKCIAVIYFLSLHTGPQVLLVYTFTGILITINC